MKTEFSHIRVCIFIHFLLTSHPDNAILKDINPKMEVEYMTLMQRDRENIELGREEGRQEGAKMALDIIRLHMDGKTDQEIAAILSLRTDYVRQFLVDYENSQG